MNALRNVFERALEEKKYSVSYLPVLRGQKSLALPNQFPTSRPPGALIQIPLRKNKKLGNLPLRYDGLRPYPILLLLNLILKLRELRPSHLKAFQIYIVKCEGDEEGFGEPSVSGVTQCTIHQFFFVFDPFPSLFWGGFWGLPRAKRGAAARRTVRASRPLCRRNLRFRL